MARDRYRTDLTDAEWKIVEPHLPPSAERGRPREHGWREILNGVFYLVPSGDRDGVKLLLSESIKEELPRFSHVWLDGGYKGEGKGKEWSEQQLGWTAEIVQHPPKPRGVWARPDQVIDWSKIMPPPGFRVLPRRSRCRENIFLVRAKPTTEQRLRALDGERRSANLHRHDPAHAQAIDPKTIAHFQTVSHKLSTI